MRVYPPPKAHEVAKKEKEEEAAAKMQFEDDFDELSSVGTTKSARTVRSVGRLSASGKSLGASEFGTSAINELRETQKMRKIKNVNDDLDRQIYTGWVEANLECLSVDEMLTMFKKVPEHADMLDALRITCLPREFEIPWEDRNKPTCEVPFYRYGNREHRALVRAKSDLLLGEALRISFSRMVKAAMSPKLELTHLELGVALSDGGLTILGELVAASETLERLSLCGSCIGDHGLVVLKDGINANKTLRELDLTGCALTDLGAAIVASLLKGHATCRGNKFWQEMLREYPPNNVNKLMRARIFERQQMQVQSRVARSEGGLLLLELRENKISDDGAALIYDALQIDGRLMLLSLRRNKISLVWQEVFAALIAEHPSLQQVDFRGNRSSYMGIIRKRTNLDELMLHLRTTKSGVYAWKGIPISRYQLKENYNLRLENCLNTPRSWAFRKKTKKELKEEARAQQRIGSFEEDEDELFGEFDDPGIADFTGENEDREEKSLPDLMPKVPRLAVKSTSRIKGSTSASGGRPKAVQLTLPSKVPSFRSFLPSSGMPAQKPAVGVSGKNSERAPSSTGSRRRSSAPKPRLDSKKSKANNEEMVEEMSGVLLQLHNLVSQFESLAYTDPQLLVKAAGLNMPSRFPASPAVQEIAAQLKKVHELDDSIGVDSPIHFEGPEKSPDAGNT